MQHLPLILAVLLLGAWLFVTWYHADDQPVFGPNATGRVTFKTVVKNALHDLIEITRPVWMRVWLNAPFAAVMAVDAVSLMQEDLRNAIFGNFYGGIALVALNLLARYGSTAAHPPVAAR